MAVVVAVAMFAANGGDAFAKALSAGPTDYRQVVRELHPGDVLTLRPGVYVDGLDVKGLLGKADAMIVIRGDRRQGAAIFVASVERNTLSIGDTAFVHIADLDLDGRGAPVDAVKAEGTAHFAHHIVLEGLRISGYAADQQNVGISTKCPAWNWTIRGNRIDTVGTGMYLGNSDGTAPFVRGVIEGNIVTGTLGYSLQIKHQREWPESIPVAALPGQTIIRYNTFAKDERSTSGALARPNVLLGHWPLTGRGADERYLVYGNLFLDNPSEALFQAEGNVTLYNNVFVNRHGDGVGIREHNDVPRRIDMFHNTVLARDSGILLRNADPAFRQSVAGNAIFAGGATLGTMASGNFVRRYDEAGTFLREAKVSGRVLDLAPRGQLLDDGHWQPSGREMLPDVRLDFDRKTRTAEVYGAYAGGRPAAPYRFQR